MRRDQSLRGWTNVVLAGLATCFAGALGLSQGVHASITDLPLDTSFNPTGPHPGITSEGPFGTSARQIVPLRDGSMLVIGFTTVAKVTSGGAVDALYGDAATPGLVTVPIPFINWYVLDGNEELYVGDGIRIWRISATGALSATPIYEVHSSADLLSAIRPVGIDSQNRLLVQGAVGLDQVGGSAVLARLTRDGAIDTSFAPMATHPGLREITSPGAFAYMRPDESFIVISSYLGMNMSVQHLYADGSVDASWNNGQGVLSLNGDLNGLEVDGVAFTDDNTLYLTGTVVPPQPCTGCRTWAGRISANGVFDMSFYMNANAPMSRFEASKSPLVEPDGHVLILVQPSAGKTGVMVLDAAGNPDAQYGWTGSDAGYHSVVSNLPGSGAMMARDIAGRPLIAGLGGRVARFRAPVGHPVGYVPLVPERLLDTRPQTRVGYSVPHKPFAGDTVVLQVAGAGKSNIPADAAAAVLNVTGTEPDANGFVTVWPCGTPRPTASNLNLERGKTSPNLVISRIGSGGNVCLFTQPSTHLIADVSGYFPAGTAYSSLVPERLLDTRPESRIGYNGQKPAAGDSVRVRVTGVGSSNVPADAGAVVLNVTGTEATADGYVTAWPCGATRPLASNLNLRAHATAPNLVVVRVGDSGDVCLFTQSGTHLIADIAGYFPASSSFIPLVPERLLDTRPSSLAGYSGGKPSAGDVVQLHVTGEGSSNIPADAAAVALNITVTSPATNGFVTVWPCGAPRPTASNLNFTNGQTVPNLAIVGVGSNGNVCLYTMSEVDLIADVSGYLVP